MFQQDYNPSIGLLTPSLFFCAGVDHGRLDAAMAKELLYGSDVITVLDEVGCKGMTKGV